MYVSVFLADDNSDFRFALRLLLDMQQGVVVIGEAANGRDAVAQVVENPPDIAILDITMPELNGIEATQQICQQCPAIQVIIVSSHDTEPYIHNAFQAGVRGYILKKFVVHELASALDAVNAGEYFLSEQLASTRRRK